jgi:hypothetical protein
MEEDLNTINNTIHASTFERTSQDSYSCGPTAEHRITSEIKSIKMRNDFYRYLSCKIQSSPLENRVMHRYTNFYISIFTEEVLDLIEGFVLYAVEIFNKSHPTQTTTVQKILQTLEE